MVTVPKKVTKLLMNAITWVNLKNKLGKRSQTQRIHTILFNMCVCVRVCVFKTKKTNLCW
jgi:hypothetical protein